MKPLSWTLSLIVLFGMIIVSTKCKKIAWIPLKDFQEDQFEPHGRDDHPIDPSGKKYLTYIARTHFMDGHVIGKYYPFVNETIFPKSVPFANTPTYIEILNFPEMSVSWVDVVGSEIPSSWKMIEVGNIPQTKESMYICRGYNQLKIFTGVFVNRRGLCQVFIGDGTIEFEINTFELLVDNYFGNILGTKADFAY